MKFLVVLILLSLADILLFSEAVAGDDCEGCCASPFVQGLTAKEKLGKIPENSPILRISAKPNLVYRALRPDESPHADIVARDPSAKKTIQSHVCCGCRPNYKSQFISATFYYNVTQKYAPKSRVVEIDVSKARKAGCTMTDLSKGWKLKGLARSFAIASKEVVFKGRIPQSAFRIVKDGRLDVDIHTLGCRHSHASCAVMTKSVFLLLSFLYFFNLVEVSLL